MLHVNNFFVQTEINAYLSISRIRAAHNVYARLSSARLPARYSSSFCSARICTLSISNMPHAVSQHSYRTAPDSLPLLLASIDRCCARLLSRPSFALRRLSLYVHVRCRCSRAYRHTPSFFTWASSLPSRRSCPAYISDHAWGSHGGKTEAAIRRHDTRRHDTPAWPMRADQHVLFPAQTCCARTPVLGIRKIPSRDFSKFYMFRLAFFFPLSARLSTRNFTRLDSRFLLLTLRASFYSKFYTFRFALFTSLSSRLSYFPTESLSHFTFYFSYIPFSAAFPGPPAAILALTDCLDAVSCSRADRSLLPGAA